MKRIAWFVAAMAVVGSEATAQVEPPGDPEFRGIVRDEQPEKISIYAGPGAFVPLGDFGDAVDPGIMYTLGGFYRWTEHVAPTFAFEHAFLSTNAEETGFDERVTHMGLYAGARVFLNSEDDPVRVWLTGRLGWARYASDVRSLTPVVAVRRDDRNDVIGGVGGGVDIHLGRNAYLGTHLRANLSFSTGRDDGEENLASLVALAFLTLRY